MNANQKLMLVLILSSVISFVFAALFVIFYFRIYPNKMLMLFPVLIAVGLGFGLLYYPAVKSFLEKKEEK
jgi:hypothetical protein